MVVDRQTIFVGQRDGVGDLAASVTEGVAVSLATTSSVVSVT
ncbi:hypothetical protein [Pseudomonas monteilii]|nr:hypothetical protein [Pseudomonas monteilii]